MDHKDVAVSGIGRARHPVPDAGLHEVLRRWSGAGQVWEALASIQADDGDIAEVHWTARNIRRRAFRILLSLLEPHVVKWPSTAAVWLDALPAESVRTEILTTAPIAGTSWKESFRRSGRWVPPAFQARQHKRVADSLLLTTLRWTLEMLSDVWSDAKRVEASADAGFRRQLTAAHNLRSVHPVLSAEAIAPTASDVRAVRAEGYPWNVLAPVTDRLRVLTESLDDLAARLLMPSEELRPRLFHLAVLGTLLVALRETGFRVTSVRPLSASVRGPSYVAVDPQGRTWHIWFEAGGVWSFYKKSSPYIEATSQLGVRQPLSPDIVLLLPGQQALILECKYSSDIEYVARRGVTQALAYAVEARTQLAQATRALIVIPDGVVSAATSVDTFIGSVGVTSPQWLAEETAKLIT